MSGNIFSGKVYKTWAELPGAKLNSAYEGAYLYTVKDGWKILQSDKEMGVISAAQGPSYAKGKTVPLNITLEKSGTGSKISINYSTSAGMVSPEDAIKSHFCKTIAAAESTSDGVAEAAAPSAQSNKKPGGKAPLPDSAAAAPAQQDEPAKGQKGYKKNGLPCLAEICIGDGLEELSHLKLERSSNPLVLKDKLLYTSNRKMTAGELDVLKKNYQGDLAKAAPYLSEGVFDALALPALAKVTTACNAGTLIGKYVTDSGNPTQISIAMQPDLKDPSVQRWTVVSLFRTLAGVVTKEQKEEAKNQLDQRYGEFSAAQWRSYPKTGDGQYVLDFNGTAFSLLYFRGTDNENRIKMHPFCGGTAKVKLD